ncbi:MAG: HEPN domain-containing protein [Candidatus Edwardsbacteria bacterium]|nr:HEPN domain-containing protein [Candidatus Edwardsbacteria bacterium]
MKKATKNWIDGAEYDLKTASSLFNSGRYIYVVFMCHLAIEKSLKAVISEANDVMPPRTHDLLRLTQLSKLDVPEEKQEILTLLDGVSVPVRYPEDLKELQKSYKKQEARKILNSTYRLIKWLRPKK